MFMTPLDMDAGDWILSGSYLSKSCSRRGISFMADCRMDVVDVVAVDVVVDPDGRTTVVPFCSSTCTIFRC